MYLLLTAMDPSISRFNPADFDDQTCMEMLFQGFDMNLQARFQDMHDNFIAFCQPQSVFLAGSIRCNANEEVTQISIQGSEQSSAVALTGTLETRFLPRKLERLRIARRLGDPKRKDSEVGGTIDFVAMPDALTSIQLIGVAFSGTVAFRQLPSSLLDLNLSQCVFSGSADLTALPRRIVSLDISENAFTGSIDITKLPPSISCVNVRGNEFHGTLSFDALPGSLKTLELANNNFRGSIPLEVLPKSLLLLVITKNSFSGRLETHKGPELLEVKGVLSNNFYEMKDTMATHGTATWGWQEEKGKGEEKAEENELGESKPAFAWGSDFKCDAAPKFNWSWKPATEDKPEEEAKPLGNDPEKPTFQWTLPDNTLRGKKDTENDSKPKFKWTLD